MKYRRKLFSYKDAFAVNDTNELFLKAVKENCLYHYNHCKEYKKILDGMKFHPDDLKTIDDLSKLPFLPTLIFKKHKLYSVPAFRTIVKATSSGTAGMKSEIGFCVSDLYSGLKMVFSRTFALKYSNGKYNADLEGILNAVIKYSKSKMPVRFMGFPSYTYFLMKMMDERNIRVKLPANSKILLGGGWKQFYTEQVDKSVFYDLAKKVLNIDDWNIIEFFGAVEHPVLYCDCKNHHFHVPIYSRVLIRDVDTLDVLDNGEEGLVNLITPMVKACPILSVMTDDLGILHDGENCSCGINSPYLEIIRRIGMKDIKTCAAGAAEILKEVNL